MAKRVAFSLQVLAVYCGQLQYRAEVLRAQVIWTSEVQAGITAHACRPLEHLSALQVLHISHPSLMLTIRSKLAPAGKAACHARRAQGLTNRAMVASAPAVNAQGWVGWKATSSTPW